MKKRRLLFLTYFVFLSTIILMSCNNSTDTNKATTSNIEEDTSSSPNTVNNDTTAKTSMISDSTTTKAALAQQPFPVFTFYFKSGNAPLQYFVGRGAKSLRFIYKEDEELYVNGKKSDCDGGDASCDNAHQNTDNNDRDVEKTSHRDFIVEPSYQHSDLVLPKKDLDKIRAFLQSNPGLTKISLRPIMLPFHEVEAMDLNENTKSYLQAGQTYLSYYFTVGNNTYTLNPHPPGSLPNPLTESSSDTIPNSKKAKNSK